MGNGETRHPWAQAPPALPGSLPRGSPSPGLSSPLHPGPPFPVLPVHPTAPSQPPVPPKPPEPAPPPPTRVSPPGSSARYTVPQPLRPPQSAPQRPRPPHPPRFSSQLLNTPTSLLPAEAPTPATASPAAALPYPRVAAHIEPQQRAGRRGEQAPQEPGGQEADAALGGVEAGIIGEVAVGSSAGLQGGKPPTDGRRHFVVCRARAPGGAETFRGKMVPRGGSACASLRAAFGGKNALSGAFLCRSTPSGPCHAGTGRGRTAPTALVAPVALLPALPQRCHGDTAAWCGGAGLG